MQVLRFSDVSNEETWNERCKELIEQGATGVCFYTDGGYKRDKRPPNASWGVHGYFYNEEKATRTSRYKLKFPTKMGYQDLPKERSEIVNSFKVLNFSAPIPGKENTNNTAELQAFIIALDLLLKTNLKTFIKEYRVFLDSKYVLDNALLHLNKWKLNNWRLGSGMPVQNLEYWKTIDGLLAELEELDIDVVFKHCKGHEDYGNIIVDNSCTLSIETGIAIDNFCDEEWYYSKEIDVDPMYVEQRYLHFPGMEGRVADYITMFSFTDTTIPISALGNRINDLSIGMIKTDDEVTIKAMKKIHRQCVELEDKIAPVPMVVDVKSYLNNKNDYLIKNNLISKLPRVEEIDKVFIKDPVSDAKLIQVITPPRNSYKLLSEIDKVDRVLRQLEEGSELVAKTDVTEHFYKYSEEKDKNNFKLLTEQFIQIEVDYHSDGELVKGPVILTIGLDLPRRRVLANIATLKPKISVVTWDRGLCSFRYGVLVETDKFTGFWFTPYGNTCLTT